MRFKLSMSTTHVPSHINITYLLPPKNFTYRGIYYVKQFVVKFDPLENYSYIKMHSNEIATPKIEG